MSRFDCLTGIASSFTYDSLYVVVLDLVCANWFGIGTRVQSNKEERKFQDIFKEYRQKDGNFASLPLIVLRTVPCDCRLPVWDYMTCV